MNYCVLCGRECTGEVCCDDGYEETIFGMVSTDPRCKTCCEPTHPPERRNFGFYERMDCDQ